MYPGSYQNPYSYPYLNPYPYIVHFPNYSYSTQSVYSINPFDQYEASRGRFQFQHSDNDRIMLKDYGAEPLAVNINKATKENNTFRTALWTGRHFQVTLMSLKVGEDIGLEMHPDVDQFLRIEQGEGVIQMGKSRGNLTFRRNVSDDFAIIVPAGSWHNLTNTGHVPLKLYSIYAPPNHRFGTVHVTKEEAQIAELMDL
ncbi:cupin domain-containing protein [Metabacillus niabensis]|uniref:cupin domain-containing protein n=1 Tax=Metabacillus niabensis TaxID=324854 RepID=UPI0039A25CD1